MKTYLVGGAVRDALMGLPVKDRDWVVVGATPQDLLNAGYTPVGRDFPVFLHPQSHEEYALARTERKTAPGYQGFAVHAAPDVTLEQDLARRDLTINSIAAHADSTVLTGLIDPYGGQIDIANQVLRHVTVAFREDPVRILRTARFAARFAGFSVAPETLALMQEMVRCGETDHLVAERVWQELATGLMEARPSRMFEVLHECGALTRLLPELQTGTEHLQRLDQAAGRGSSLAVRYALIDTSGNSALHQRLRVPLECSELSRALALQREGIVKSATMDAEALVRLLERCDALRKPGRFAEMLEVCSLESPGLDTRRLSTALELVRSVATDSIASVAQSTGASGQEIGEMIRCARIAAVASRLSIT
jgi:tRNA nucleotidyltransferase (CCA-adding enzyme)